MSEFLTIGEPLVVFASTQLGRSIETSTNFNKTTGGAELNVATGVALLGHQSDYIGAVGNDPHGRFIKLELKKKGISTDDLKIKADDMTGYQVKGKVAHGDPVVYNFRKNSAASHLDAEDLKDISLNDVKWLHISGIFLGLSSKTYDACRYLVEKARKCGITISFDPNLRPDIWSSKQEMIDKINEFAHRADIVLPGRSEGQALTGSNRLADIANHYLKSDVTKAVYVKDGAKGVYFQQKNQKGQYLTGYHVKHVVDTVGAGDGFAVGVITSLLEGGTYEAAGMRGNAIGAMQVQTPGDNDGYPNRQKLKEFMCANSLEGEKI